MSETITATKTSLVIDKVLHRALKVIAAQSGKTISALFNEGMHLIVAKYGKGK